MSVMIFIYGDHHLYDGLHMFEDRHFAFCVMSIWNHMTDDHHRRYKVHIYDQCMSSILITMMIKWWSCQMILWSLHHADNPQFYGLWITLINLQAWSSSTQMWTKLMKSIIQLTTGLKTFLIYSKLWKVLKNTANRTFLWENFVIQNLTKSYKEIQF